MTPTQRHVTRLVQRVAKLYELTPSEVLTETETRRRSTFEARRLAYLVAHVGLGLSTGQIGEAVGDTHQAVRHHITRAVALTKSSRVFRAVYQTVLKATVREFERSGIELPGAAE